MGATAGPVRGRRWAVALVVAGPVLLVSVCTPDPVATPAAPSASSPPSVPAVSSPPSASAVSSPPSASAVSSPPSASAASSVPEAVACVEQVLAGLTPAQRAGQVLMVGVPVEGSASAATAVRVYGPGGVFLRGRSADAATEVRQRIALLQRAASGGTPVPLHVAVDQEGGQVQTLSGRGIGALPSALTQGRWPTAVLQARVEDRAAALRGIGVTMNLAPVADTVPGDPERNPPVGAADRHFGSLPEAVAEDVVTVTRATQRSGVVATLKHFPGLGRVRVNTDFSTGATDALLDRGDPLLRPFAAGIEAGAGAVMLSSARYPRLDPRRLAVFSPDVVTLLRSDLRFEGLVVSDDLGAAKAVQSVPVGRRAVAFVAAGGDLVLTVRVHDARPMGTALAAAARSSPQFRRRLDDAVRHVLVSKYRVGLLRC
jgi:beta-N-acetylhexosaminidase